jgi:hypothetical protein
VEDSEAGATLSSSATITNCNHELQRLVDTGLNLGGFLCEAGRYQEAHLVYQVQLPVPIECSREIAFSSFRMKYETFLCLQITKNEFFFNFGHRDTTSAKFSLVMKNN